VIICIILATTAKFLSESGMAMHRNLNRKLAAGFQGGFEDQMVRQGGHMSLDEIVDPTMTNDSGQQQDFAPDNGADSSESRRRTACAGIRGQIVFLESQRERLREEVRLQNDKQLRAVAELPLILVEDRLKQARKFLPGCEGY
jgi:hypothetical protein